MSVQSFGATPALDLLLVDPRRESGIPISQVVPIRWRQVFRSCFARFFRSRVHVGIVLADIALLAIEQWDSFGILSLPLFRAGLILLLVYEVAFFLIDLLYQTLYFRNYVFDIREQSLVIRRGVICKQEITLPLFRITDVFLDQDMWGRLLGVCDLHVSTATSISGRRAHIVGVDVDGAKSLRQMLLRLINAS